MKYYVKGIGAGKSVIGKRELIGGITFKCGSGSIRTWITTKMALEDDLDSLRKLVRELYNTPIKTLSAASRECNHQNNVYYDDDYVMAYDVVSCNDDISYDDFKKFLIENLE